MFCCCKNVQVVDTSTPEIILTELDKLELDLKKLLTGITFQ